MDKITKAYKETADLLIQKLRQYNDLLLTSTLNLTLFSELDEDGGFVSRPDPPRDSVEAGEEKG